MIWSYYTTLKDFPPQQLYEVLRLRQEIFIIEQKCIYDDIDGKDGDCSHLLLFSDSSELIGYLRIVPPKVKFEEVSLGRIVVRKEYRKQGLGKILIERGIELARNGKQIQVKIEAQAHLERYYARFGFATVSEPYDVDGIPHLQMVV